MLKKRATHLITIIQNVIRFRGPTFVFAGKREEKKREKRAEHRETNEPLSSGAVFLRDEVVAVSQLRLRELLRHRHRACSVLLLCLWFSRRGSPSQKKKGRQKIRIETLHTKFFSSRKDFVNVKWAPFSFFAKRKSKPCCGFGRRL